eukprot:CAMPEP_0179885960 /NCGR_PEP_ID=MMETSP0982-20121206/30571_1 /TAXON_ID=483367 /ORGANISM="non described non described, Strain CCMP 2436" /LENGTH=50 /DNA_ID=CAMNT_0021781599 /DNA_START=37 /DNA_END=186 /DNA_ORIENTATION=-
MEHTLRASSAAHECVGKLCGCVEWTRSARMFSSGRLMVAARLIASRSRHE